MFIGIDMTTPRNTLPTQQRLHELFYCVNGQLIVKSTHPKNHRTHVGDIAGCVQSDGYIDTTVDGKRYTIHRLIWKWYYGVDPGDIIDHIDGDKSNNNIWNLREVTEVENHHNRTIHRTEGRGPKQVTVNGKRVLTEWGKECKRRQQGQTRANADEHVRTHMNTHE